MITADDFGLTTEINRGIMEAFEAGALRSVSIMVGTPGFEDAAAHARRSAPHLGVGLHLTLTLGRPLTVARSLTDARGRFLSPGQLAARALAGSVRGIDVQNEVLAQLARARAAGLRITHLDGHHHAHALPGIRRAVWRAARRAGIPVVRRPVESFVHAPCRFRRLPARLALRLLARGAPRNEAPVAVGGFAGHSLLGAPDFQAGLLRFLEQLPAGVTELMVHPGYVGGPLPGNDPYRDQREVELRALTSQATLRALRTSVRVLHFGELETPEGDRSQRAGR